MIIEDLFYWRHEARLTAIQAAELCGVTLRTWQRWECSTNPPKAVRELIRLHAGYLPLWSGWQVRCGLLWSPEGVCFAEGELRALPFRYALLAELEKQLYRPLVRAGAD